MNKAVIEREIRTVLEGTRANLTQAGLLPDSLWPYAQHHATALNTTKRLNVARIPWENRFGTPFNGLMVPFGATVIFWNNPKQNIAEASKFAPTGEEGIFVGFHIQLGFIWRKEYLLAPLKGSRDVLANGTLKVVRAKRVEIPHRDFTFPLADKEPSKPPRLDDQDCYADGAGPDDDGDDGPPGGDDPGDDDGSDPKGDPPSPPSGEADDDGEAVDRSRPGERSTVDGMSFGDLFGDRDDDEDEGLVPSSGSRNKVAADPKPRPEPSRPPEGAESELFDPLRFPDGRPVPQGFNWDGVRLVRKEKRSKRPPDTPSEFWCNYSKQERGNGIARWERKIQLHQPKKQKPTLVGFSRFARRRVRSFPKDTLNRSGKAAASFKATRCWMKTTIMRFLRNLGLAASMEAAKIIDILLFSKQQADARQAYTQALLQGVET